MLFTSSQITDGKVISLHIGRPVATLSEPIIDPNKLEIVGFYCDGSDKHKNKVLLTQDIRETTGNKVLIDSADEITSADHLIRLQDVLKLKFKLLGKPVITETDRKIGIVREYVLESKTFLIQKLYVKPPILRSLMLDHHVIDRNQIIEVTDKKIVVTDSAVRADALAKQPVPGV